MAQRAETTVAEFFLTSCVWARFPDRFPLYAWTAESTHSDFVESRVYACLDATCHLHFWQNDRGLLRVTAVTWGWNRHRIRVSTERYIWRTFPRRSCRNWNLQPFDHESGALPTSYPGYENTQSIKMLNSTAESTEITTAFQHTPEYSWTQKQKENYLD